MRLILVGTSVTGAAALALAAVVAQTPEKTQRPVDPPGAIGAALAQASRSESAARLPVARVVLFNSGVGDLLQGPADRGHRQHRLLRRRRGCGNRV